MSLRELLIEFGAGNTRPDFPRHAWSINF